MGRLKKDNADYFSHEKDMRNDVKIKALRRKFGHTGYAVWNYLLEVLTNASGFRIRWEDLDVELYAADFDLETDELKEIVAYCQRLELIQVCDGNLCCAKLSESFSTLLDKREKDCSDKREQRQIRATKPKNEELSQRQNQNSPIVAATKPENEDCRSDKTTVKYSKEEYSILENNISNAHTPACAQEKELIYEIFFWKNIMEPAQETERFLEFYADKGYTREKLIKAAQKWMPKSKESRVNQKFLEVWSALHTRMLSEGRTDIAKAMLDSGSRCTFVNNVARFHARDPVRKMIENEQPEELMRFIRNCHFTTSWP